MKRIKMLNSATGTVMLVAEDRKGEYLEAGHKLYKDTGSKQKGAKDSGKKKDPAADADAGKDQKSSEDEDKK